MAATTNKEYLASLAFAYFIVDPDFSNETHQDNWIDIFKNYRVSTVKEKYAKHVEPNFKFGALKSQYSFKTGKGDAHLYVVYNQMKELFQSSFINTSKNYRVYGQNSIFSKTVKDACLVKVGQAFSGALSQKAKLVDLSPADFFIVNEDVYNNILKDFKTNVIKNPVTTILKNYKLNNEFTYNNLIRKYFISKDLIPISHKMADAKSHKPTIKIAGDLSRINTSKKHIDPYSQMLLALSGKTPSQIERLIDTVVEIDYNRWDIRESVSSSTWKLYFRLDYKKIDPNFDVDVFGLEPLPSEGSGSFNGKFYFENLKSKTPWVAGMAPASLKPFLESYPEYNTIMTHFGKKRVKIFEKVLYDMIYRQKKNKSLANSEVDVVKSNRKYNDVIQFLENKDFHSFKSLSKKMDELMQEIKYPLLFRLYQQELIKQIRKEGQFTTYLSKISSTRLHEHYTSLQMAYFLFHGGQKFKLYTKKKIFMTIFGAISKRGFIKITDSGVKNLISKEFENGKAIMKSSPHLVLL